MAVKYYDLNFDSKRTYLGNVGYYDENDYRALRIDVSSVLADYPGASFRVVLQRAQDAHPYTKPAGEVTLTDKKLTAELTETDLNMAGRLLVQVVFEFGTVVGKSGVFIADVGRSLSSDTTDPLSPYADALAEIEEAIDRMNQFINTGGGSIAIDKTLSKSDMAAESKAVGTALAALEAKIGTGGGGGASVELDTTLSQSGKAADAKAVGDALKNKADTSAIPSKLSQLSDDSNNRTVTDAEKTAWNNKSNFSGAYNDLTGKPTIPDAYTKAEVDELLEGIGTGGGGSGVTPQLLYTTTAENITQIKEAFDTSKHNNFAIVMIGTKAEAKISINGGYLIKGGKYVAFSYYTVFLPAAGESYPEAALTHTINYLSEDLALVTYLSDTSKTTTLSSTFQGNSSSAMAAKCGVIKTGTTKDSDGIEIKFNAAVPSVTIEVYGY